MVFQVSTPETFGFNDGNAGHVCTFTGGAPAVGDFDVLCVNSDTVVSTPAGFTALAAVANQGAYVFRRKAAGSEGAAVTVTTSGDFNCHVIWVRVRGASAPDVTGSAQANAASAALSPAFTSSVLAESGELALAFAALHTFPGAVPSSPVWSSGYTALAAGFQGAGASGAGGFVAYKTPAGTGAESPSLTWTNNAADRYVLFLSLTADPGVDGALAATLPPLSATATAVQRLDGALAATLPALTAALAQTPNTKATATSTVAAGRTSTSAVSVQRTSEHGVT